MLHLLFFFVFAVQSGSGVRIVIGTHVQDVVADFFCLMQLKLICSKKCVGSSGVHYVVVHTCRVGSRILQVLLKPVYLVRYACEFCLVN